MDIGSVMHAMRDPAGVPAIPVLFQTLMIATWVPHIAFVLLTLGAATLSIYAFFMRNAGPYWERLSIALTKVTKVGVSLLIVLGVAPLLFTQVIYDPQWYASNVLSARWAITFIFTLIIGYCLWFAFYWSNHEGAKARVGLYAFAGLLLFVLDGLIMHVLSYQAINPASWMGWYAPGGVVDTSGATLHAMQWSRYLFIMSLSAPAVGLFLIAYSDYLSVRPDKPADYLKFAKSLGRSIAQSGLAISTALSIWWLFDHPKESQLAFSLFGWLLPAALLILLGLVRTGIDRMHGYTFLALGLGVLGILAVWREIVRIAYLHPFGYAIADYKVNVDWPSLVLFFSTFIGVGGLVGGYYLTLLYQAGRVQGVYAANSRTSQLGTAAVVVLAVWIAVFFAYGVTILIRSVLAS